MKQNDKQYSTYAQSVVSGEATPMDVKRKPAIEVSITPTTLLMTFANGKELTIQPEIQLTEELCRQAMFHGLKQKLVDAAAISRDTSTGRSATIDDKYAAVKTVFDRLLAGEWNAAREGGGTGGLLFQALCRHYDGRKTPEQLREWLGAKTDADKTALRKNPKIAAIIEEIRAATGKAASVDTDALLNELNDD